MGIIADFKKFISRGNVVDMAIGVVVGGAFSKIVTSLVADIITPCITALTGGGKVAGKIVLKAAVEATETTAAVPEVAINYGNWLQTIIDFIIIALCIFLVVRVITKMREKAEILRKKEEKAAAEEAPAPAPAPEPSAEEKLLAEIRDLLREKK